MDPLRVLPFQSGWQPGEHAISRYHVCWYLVTLLFLAFDVEMLFMYPWAVVVTELGAMVVIEMFLFLSALFVAVLWAWREGALAVGVIDAIARSAACQAHVLLVEVPGHWRTRTTVERAVWTRGWSLAVSPADADLQAVCGRPRAPLVEAIELVWHQMPGPRVRVDVTDSTQVEAALDEARARLVDTERHRHDARTRPGATDLLSRGEAMDGPRLRITQGAVPPRAQANADLHSWVLLDRSATWRGAGRAVDHRNPAGDGIAVQRG